MFNGEIFNYLELRSELTSRGHIFRSLAETEVIVHAYEEWGADCVSRFNGMWAFAIWDQRKRELFCSREFGDALSMAFSIESRLPFLDHRLVEFVFRMEARHKLRGTLTKGVLREAMAGIIPEQIRARRDKVGFTTPTPRWIAQCMDSHVRPLLLSKRCNERGIFDAKKMESVLTRQAHGKVRAHAAIFRWLSVELWFRLFIDGEGVPAARATHLGARLYGDTA